MITKETVRYLATLSRLRFSDNESDLFSKDLDNIFEYASVLSRLDTENARPSAHVNAPQNVMKEDYVSIFDAEQILENAPSQENHSFCVPRILAED